MPTAPLVPVEEYIKAYIDGGRKPACEYVDGILAPKGRGTGNTLGFSEASESVSAGEITLRVEEIFAVLK